jgi:hypothetical protein
MSTPPITEVMLCARVPAYCMSAWCGEGRHPESADDFGTVANMQHIARTLAKGGFELMLVDPPESPARSRPALDPSLCALVLALAAPCVRVGLSRDLRRRALQADPGHLLGAQWAGIAPVPITCSVKVLVAGTRWMAEDQFTYLEKHFPQVAAHRTSPVGPVGEAKAEAAQDPALVHDTDCDPAILVGTPAEVVDELEDMVRAQCAQAAAAGTPVERPAIELVPVHIPGSYEAFVRMVVPQLRRRGLIGEHAATWRPIT